MSACALRRSSRQRQSTPAGSLMAQSSVRPKSSPGLIQLEVAAINRRPLVLQEYSVEGHVRHGSRPLVWAITAKAVNPAAVPMRVDH